MRFETDIKPLFSAADRNGMLYAFDLWSFADVKDNAGLILERVEDGSMPPDEPWDEAKIAILKAWVAAGCPA